MRFIINNAAVQLIAKEGFDVEVNPDFLRLSRDGAPVAVVHIVNGTVDTDELMRVVKSA